MSHLNNHRSRQSGSRQIRRALGLSLGLAWGLVLLPPAGQAVRASTLQPLIQLLETKRCEGCQLTDADLAGADLRDGDLRGAQLRRANLSRAVLDGARLSGADLGFTSLLGASLRGADLRGARLEGTDLRQADLSGAKLDPGALAAAHWQGATGIDASQQSYGELHNAGVDASRQGHYPQAEQYFSDAIRRQPDAAISWVARGITRSEQGKTQLAAQDFTYAASLYERGGELDTTAQLRDASRKLLAAGKKPQGGNGLGTQLMGGAMAAFQFLAPIAAKALIPMGI